MSKHSYKEILEKAKECKKTVEKEFHLGVNSKWGYYFAKAIITPKKDIEKITFDEAPNPNGDNISRQISKSNYIDLAKDLIQFVENDKHKRLPNYLTYKGLKIRTRVYVEFFARILVFYSENNRLPSEVNINNKVFTKPLEPSNEVYKYFVKIFGSFDNTVDGFLKKIEGLGYGYYYDDVLSNKQTIDNLKKKGANKPNCTDSCQMAMNVIKQLVIWGLYKKVECLHVDCSSGGHVKLRITKNDGSTFIRDIACIISDNGKPLTCVWCTNTPKAVNPSWFMSNLNR